MLNESEDEWELSKENIQPIQQGRKQKVLKVALAPHPEDSILQQRHAFEHELRTYSGADILSVWCEYIGWVEQNFPKGGRDGQIKQLIERCLAILKDEKKYYDDERYVDILLKFANISEKPLDVFNYMYTHNIGCKLAKFFITWSWELEQFGNYKRANQVLTEGFQRQAQPIEKIKAYRNEFDVRLASKIREGTENMNFESDSQRSAFTMLKPQKQKLAPIERTGEAVIDKKKPLLLGRQRQPNPSKISNSKVPFKIYNSENAAPLLPVQHNSAAHSILNLENSKENEQKPSKWNKIKVKTRVHSIRPQNEVNLSFKFHCDEENIQDHCTPRPVPKTSTVLSSRCRSPSPVMALFEPHDPLKRPMYPKSKVYGGAEEYSLEEIRAAEWFEKKKLRDRELFLKEEDKIIEQKAREKEKLEREINQLTKRMKMLQNNLDAPKSIPVFNESVTDASPLCLPRGDLKEVCDIKGQIELNQDANFLFERQPQSNAQFYFKNTSENMYSKFFNGSKMGSADALDAKTDTTGYRKADKMVQELYNNTLSQSVDNSDSKTTAELSTVAKHNPTSSCMPNSAYQHHTDEQVPEANKQTSGWPFELYHDPTVTMPAAKSTEILPQVTALPSKIQSSSSEQSSLVKKGDIDIKTNLPFTFFHDVTEEICQSAQLTLQPPASYTFPKKDIYPPATVSEENQDDLENVENVPPRGFVQEKNKRELAGILEPSRNVLYIPLEEQENLQDESDDEDVCPPRNLNANETLIPPSNTEQFSSDLFYRSMLASTPCVLRNAGRKPCLTEPAGENVPLTSTKLLETKTPVDEENHISPYQNVPDSQQAVTEVKDRSSKVPSVDPCLPKMLSVIMETSSENYSKSSTSSNSSASLTKSGHLDPSHFSSVRKLCPRPDTLSSIEEVPDPTFHEYLQKIDKKLNLDREIKDTQEFKLNQLYFDPFDTQETLNHHPSHFSSVHKPLPRPDTLSLTVEVPEPTFHKSLQEIDRTSNEDRDVEDTQEFKLNPVDFDPFDTKETLNHLNSIDLTNYANLYYVNRSIKYIKWIGEELEVGDSKYSVERLVNEGSYAKVYQAMRLISLASFDQDLNLKNKFALKVCKNSNEWEFFICSEMVKRLAKLNQLPDVKNSFMDIISAVKFQDGIVLLNEYSSRGTLLDMINFYKKKNSTIPEVIIMYLTLEILHIVSRLHKLNIIHGDIKTDNFLIMNSAFGSDVLNCLPLSTTTLRLIDFGRAIDLCQYKKGVCFTTTLDATHFKCTEMRENKPWVFQLDWYGVLSCIHAMLFLEYMSVRKKDDKWEIEKKFKRYWYTSLWQPLFSELLNIPACYSEPDIKKFTDMIEARLQQNPRQFVTTLQGLYSLDFKN